MPRDLPLSPATPAILGMDFAGTIEAVGEGATEYSVGDEVYGCAGGLADLPGSLAAYMVADSNLIAHRPKNLSLKEAAALPLVAMLHNCKREQHAEILRNLAQIAESGGLKPVLDEKRFSIGEVGQAYARLESGQGMGKVVVEN